MAFNPGYKIGQELKNADIVSTFGCGNMGGMRRSHGTNTLVIVSDYTKGIYHDKWIGGILHYTGMGKNGDQDIKWAQNATLANCGYNGVDVHLFEVMDSGVYVYCGRIELVGKPYTEVQPGENGINRKVWMFPVRPVPDNNVIKPSMFVFEDMADYKARGKNVDKEYALLMEENKQKRSGGKKIDKRIIHRIYGTGTVLKIVDGLINVTFDDGTKRTLDEQICVDKGLIEYI